MAGSGENVERALPHYWPAGDEREASVWWCKDHTDFIIEHVTTVHEGHRGHVKCVRVADHSGRRPSDG